MDARIVDGRKIARVTDDGKLKVLVHGRDGDDLVPVKVGEDGYLMLSRKKARLDTIVDAYSLAAGAANFWNMGMTDESDVYAIISCDKGPWRATVNAPWGGSYYTDGLYPRRESEAATTVGYAKASRIIIPGSSPADASEAANRAIGAWPTSGNIRFANNHDTDTATVTIKMLRVWR